MTPSPSGAGSRGAPRRAYRRAEPQDRRRAPQAHPLDAAVHRRHGDRQPPTEPARRGLSPHQARRDDDQARPSRHHRRPHPPGPRGDAAGGRGPQGAQPGPRAPPGHGRRAHRPPRPRRRRPQAPRPHHRPHALEPRTPLPQGPEGLHAARARQGASPRPLPGRLLLARPRPRRRDRRLAHPRRATAFVDDRIRDAELAIRDIVVIRVTDEQVDHDLAATIDRLRRWFAGPGARRAGDASASLRPSTTKGPGSRGPPANLGFPSAATRRRGASAPPRATAASSGTGSRSGGCARA